MAARIALPASVSPSAAFAGSQHNVDRSGVGGGGRVQFGCAGSAQPVCTLLYSYTDIHTVFVAGYSYVRVYGYVYSMSILHRSAKHLSPVCPRELRFDGWKWRQRDTQGVARQRGQLLCPPSVSEVCQSASPRARRRSVPFLEFPVVPPVTKQPHSCGAAAAALHLSCSLLASGVCCLRVRAFIVGTIERA